MGGRKEGILILTPHLCHFFLLENVVSKNDPSAIYSKIKKIGQG